MSADTIVPGAGNPQAFNRYAYVKNNPLKYTDPSGHFAWFATGAVGLAIGGIVGGALYYANNQNTFNRDGFWATVGAGALAGGLIGSGIGLLALPTATAALATSATAMVGAGTGAAGSAVGYAVTHQDAFETTAFVETTAVGGAIGGISAVTPVTSAGVVLKALTHIAGAETLYALQTEDIDR